MTPSKVMGGEERMSFEESMVRAEAAHQPTRTHYQSGCEYEPETRCTCGAFVALKNFKAHVLHHADKLRAALASPQSSDEEELVTVSCVLTTPEILRAERDKALEQVETLRRALRETHEILMCHQRGESFLPFAPARDVVRFALERIDISLRSEQDKGLKEHGSGTRAEGS